MIIIQPQAPELNKQGVAAVARSDRGADPLIDPKDDKREPRSGTRSKAKPWSARLDRLAGVLGLNRRGDAGVAESA